MADILQSFSNFQQILFRGIGLGNGFVKGRRQDKT